MNVTDGYSFVVRLVVISLLQRFAYAREGRVQDLLIRRADDNVDVVAGDVFGGGLNLLENHAQGAEVTVGALVGELLEG